MRIVQLQYRASPAGDFSKRLHDIFVESGIESSIVTLFSDVGAETYRHELGRFPQWRSKLDNHLQNYLTRKSDRQYGLFSYPLLGTDVSQLPELREADVIYLHWVLFGFLNYKSIAALAELGKPLVIVMHDMWSITGGCHHSFTCEKYRTACGQCQVFAGQKSPDLAARGFHKKQKLYARYDNLHFVSPSKWLYECARQSALTKHKPVYHIPNVLDRQKFKPIDKKVAKEILNIPTHGQVIAFGAVSIDSPYKGWEYLKKALHYLHASATSQKVSILVFGGADQQVLSDSIPFKTRFLGRIQDEYAMSVVYNAADVVVAPSTADNLPYVVFESLACGTPVVAFEVGGIPDLIRHKKNGYLASYKDAADLAAGMAYCLDHDLEVRTPPEFDTAATVQKHRELYETMIK